MKADAKFVYDDIPYPSYTFPKTFPDRLATMAALYGMKSADPAKCRVLELGCGDGTNLLAMSYMTPGSTFTGIDLSKLHIDRAKKSAEWIGAKNINFLQADVTEINTNELGEFDYIIAHGLFSWVPKPVRDPILKLYSKCLAPSGVGYISYNVFPGGHIRQMVWEMMQYYTQDEPDFSLKVQKARAIAAFVADSAGADSAYKAILDKEVESFSKRNDLNIFHDDLSDNNQPFYFHDIAARLMRNGLKYIADSDPEARIENALSKEALKSLEAASGGDRIRREQFADFIRGQRFRRSIFCREDVELADDVQPSAIENMLVASRLEAAGSGDTQGAKKFTGPENQTIQLNHAPTISLLKKLKREWPHAISFKAALKEISDTNLAEEDTEKCREYLLDLFHVELVALHTFQPPFVSEVSARPEASRFARLQVEIGCQVVTTMAVTNVEMNNQPLQILIALLDGKHNREDLIKEMRKQIEVSPNERQALAEQLPQMIEANLQKMAAIGLLIG